MMTGKDDAPLTRGEFNVFVKDLVDNLNEMTLHMYRQFDYVSKRFDDVDRRLESLEAKVSGMDTTIHYIKNDTKVMHPMYELVRTDGEEISGLKLRVDKLEKEN